MGLKATFYKTYGDYELGRSIGGNGYHWLTLSGTLDTPANIIKFVMPYRVITYSNTYAIVVNQDKTYPGSSSTGQISPELATTTFKSEEGVYPNRPAAEQGWRSATLSIKISGKFDAGTIYLHLGLLSGSNIKYGALDISEGSSSISVVEVRTYDIIYNGVNATSNVPAKGIKTYQQAVALDSSIPTRTGYTFVSWNTKANGTGTTYHPGDTYSEDANLALYAIWKENTLTFKMNVNGGQKASDAPASMTIVDGFALDGGTHQVITYTNRNNTIYLRQYNNKSQIKLTYPGHIITKGKEFCSASDGSGILYDQSKGYSLADFTGEDGLDNESKEITLYVNWKTGGIVHYSDGIQWVPCQMYYSDGTKWVHVMPYRSDGNEWIQCT